MKNFFTGTLAFIIYAGLCLFLYYYLFTNNLATEAVVENTQKGFDQQALNNKMPSVLENNKVATNSFLSEELDSIATKNAIDQPLLNIDGTEKNDNTIVDSLSIKTDVDYSIKAPELEKESVIYEANTFTIKDDKGNTLTQCTTFTTIYKNNPKVKIPYPCRSYGNELKELLSQNSDAQVTINGYRTNEEEKDIGKRRAQYVKKLLINIGVDSDKIIIKDDLKNIPFTSGIAQGGIDIILSNISNIEKSRDNATKNINKQLETVAVKIEQPSGPYGYKRFTDGYQGDFFYGNRSFTAYINEINKYLNSNSSKKVYVYAYTDTVGNATDNYNIGKDNVNTAKRLLIQNGIPSNRIVAVSKGETSSGDSGNNRSMVVIVK